MAASVLRIIALAVPALAIGTYGAHAYIARTSLSCPMRAPSQVELETQRRSAMIALRGERTAPTRSILGVTLEETSRADFVRASNGRGETCTEELSGALVRCDDSSKRTEVVARFSPAGRLVGIDRVTRNSEFESSTSSFRAALSNLRVTYGEPTRQWGEPTASYLAAPLRQAGVEYRFSDTAIDWSVTQMGEAGLVVREQVRSVPKPSTGGNVGGG